MTEFLPQRKPAQIAAVLLIFAAAGSGRPVAAQSGSFKVDDEVQVRYLSKWWPAKVVETNRRGDVLAEFEFAGRPRRQAFKKTEVRYPFEEGAIVPTRSWSDASGQFQIRAALIRVDEKAITLRKPDLNEITVDIAKLSDTDQAFLKRLQKELGPAAAPGPALPTVEEFQRTGAKVAGGIEAAQEPRSLVPDPVPAYLKLEEGGAAFATESVFDRLGAVIPLGGKDSWVLAAVEQRGSGAAPTRLFWASLAKKSIENRQLLPSGEIVLDYHPGSHRLLTFSADGAAGDEETNTLTIWETLPTEKAIKVIVRWNVQPETRGSREPWGRLVTGDVVLQRWTDHEYVAWDIPGKRMLYRLTQESFFAPLATLSGGRKYLFLPEDKQVRVMEAASGELVSTLPAESGASGVAITDDGQRAAVLGRNSLTLWDLVATPPAAETIQAEAIGSPFRTKIHWVDDEHLMADARHQHLLFSIKHRLALWSYVFDRDAVQDSEGRRLQDIVDGHLVYAASITSGRERGLAVGAVKLPGPQVAEAAAHLDPETLMVVKPGTAVRVVVNAGGDQARVQAALEKEVQANGWQLDPGAAITITGEMRRGETQQVTYQTMGFGPAGGGETVTVTPFISEVKVEVGGKIAWQSATSTGLPPVVSIREGESIQGEATKWQQPNPGFFEQVNIPERILDPEKRSGLGTTRVTTRGLIPET